MERTILTVTIDHKQPLPDQTVTMLENRLYTSLFAQGVEVRVKADVLYSSEQMKRVAHETSLEA